MNLRNELKADVMLNRTLLLRVKKLVCLSLGALEPNPNIDMEIAGKQLAAKASSVAVAMRGFSATICCHTATIWTSGDLGCSQSILSQVELQRVLHSSTRSACGTGFPKWGTHHLNKIQNLGCGPSTSPR